VSERTITAGVNICPGDVVAIFDDGRLHPWREGYEPCGIAKFPIFKDETVRIGDPKNGCEVIAYGRLDGEQL